MCLPSTQSFLSLSPAVRELGQCAALVFNEYVNHSVDAHSAARHVSSKRARDSLRNMLKYEAFFYPPIQRRLRYRVRPTKAECLTQVVNEDLGGERSEVVST